MIKIIIDRDVHTREMMAHELDLIAALIMDGCTEGEGWKVVGEEEKIVEKVEEEEKLEEPY